MKPLLFLLLALASSACGGPCNCSQGTRCIAGGQCAVPCDNDAGTTTCPPGTTCKTTTVYCTGTACDPAQVSVCL